MKIALVVIGIVVLWLLIGLFWNRLHPDEEAESEECPYD